MELRSYNVERIYKEHVICHIGEELGVRSSFIEQRDDIMDMLRQVAKFGNKNQLNLCNFRMDGEKWTPYLQIVIMLIRMGKKLGLVEYEGDLKDDTMIKFNV